jgi:integrase/recombinase XerD
VTNDLTERPSAGFLTGTRGFAVPAIIADEGEDAVRRFIEFFAANIRNPNTRQAYARGIGRFLRWCEQRGFRLDEIEPVVIATFIEQLGTTHAKPTVKQHLAAIRMLFDWLVIGQIVPSNPAASVRGPNYVVKRGKTPVLSAEQARELLNSIDCSKVAGLRDRALIAVMVFSFARVGAVVGMNVEDYYPEGKRWWFRLHEKGGKLHQVPAHHTADEYLDAYLQASGLSDEPKTPLFRTIDRQKRLTETRMNRHDAIRMVKRRARAAGLPASICCHTFRATGITTYLENGGTIENAQVIAAHESPRTTKLYDRTSDEITLDEIERIRI